MATADLPFEVQPQVMDITSIHQFVHFLNQWHTEKMGVIGRLAQAKAGDVFTLNDDTTITLTEEMCKGLNLGLIITQLELGVLPFHVETAAPEPEPETPLLKLVPSSDPPA